MMEEQQYTDHFIGRDEEVGTLIRWLDDPNASRILYIHDAAEEIDKKGGVGKTWLLRKFADSVRKTHPDTAVVMVDFFSIADRDRVFLTEKIVAGLQGLYPAWSPNAFTDAIQQYRGKERLLVSTSESDNAKMHDVVAAALVDDLQRLNTYLAQEQKTLLVCFDTFEVIEQSPNIAVLRQLQTFPDDYQFKYMRSIIAGRNELDWSHANWRGREQDVQVMTLAPFSQQEMQEYVDAESIYSIAAQSEQASAFYERTEGRPIIIGLAIDVLNHHILKVEDLIAVSRTDFESYLVPQVNKLEDPLNWVILFMAHVYHRFNMPILEWILRGLALDEPVRSISPENLSKLLPKLSFVRQAGLGDDFVLHDEMRRLVTKYCWEPQDTDMRFRKDISRSVISYYEQAMAHQLSEQERQGYIVEMLYHQLFVDLDDGLRYFLEQFQITLRFSQTALGRLLLQEIQKFSSAFLLAQRNAIQLAEVKLYRSDENPVLALEALQRLKQEIDPQWYEEKRIDVLLEEARCYMLQGRLLDAADCYTQCLALSQAQGDELFSAYILNSLGRLYRRRGQFSTALDYYERSIAIYKAAGRQSDYASVLTNISMVYRQQGRLEEALRRCKFAWRLRLELFQAGEVTELPLGASTHALGQIYIDAGNVIEAELRFYDAFGIYQRMNYKAGIAVIYNRFGQVQLLKGDLEVAQGWFVKAQEAAREIDKEQYINSLNKQGRICMQQQKWEEAATFFEQAIGVAELVPDYYQQTESLIDLAHVQINLEQHERVPSLLQEAEGIASRENYLSLLGSIEQMRGDIDYRAGNYTRAFHHFALYCHRMAEYNSTGFNRAVQNVVDALLDVPKHEIPAIVDGLLTYWRDHQLDRDYPELMHAFEEIDYVMIL